jgi:hypothetical protein
LDDSAIVFASVVFEGALTAVVLGKIASCDEICQIDGDGFTRLSFPRHAISAAEFADPGVTLPVVRERLSAEGFESGIRLEFGPQRWGVILQVKGKSSNSSF